VRDCSTKVLAQKKKKKTIGNVAAQNRRARHNYAILETFEAGIMLRGTEVKSLREGRASIGESYANEKDGELYLLNAHIPEYASGTFGHSPRDPRKLLLHKREIAKLFNAIQRKGQTLVPLSIYFNEKGMAKVELALAQGKQHHDKREAQKKHDWKRQQARLMRES
jgi:SsrA-binding protein